MKKTLILAAFLLVSASTFAQKKEKKNTSSVAPAQVQLTEKEEVISIPPAPTKAALIQKYAATITADDLKKHLSILASDEYEGRETGTKGQKMAADYIAKHFAGLSLGAPVSNSENPHFQSFALSKSSFDQYFIRTKKHTFNLYEDFFPYGAKFVLPETNLELVFGAYGINGSQKDTYSDYNQLNIKGKGVILINGDPRVKEGEPNTTETSNMRAKIKTAKELGALFVVVVMESDTEFDNRKSLIKSYYSQGVMGFESEEKEAAPFGVLYTSPSNAAKMLGTTTKKFDDLIKKAKKKAVSPTKYFKPMAITMKAGLKKEKVVAENVLGFLEGTDLKEEVVVVTAHYDHVGIINGQIHNGADDDGSGTVSVLEISEAFSKAAAEGFRPRRSILFMTVSGEEKGLLGSEYYSNHPIFPLANTVTNLNIDMIGRVDDAHKDNPYYVYIIGSDMLSSELHTLSEQTAKTFAPNFSLDYRYNSKDDPNQFYYRSDHYNFAKHNIPVIFYFNGTHPDYHQPTDDVEKIHFDKMAETAKLIFATTWEVAHKDTRPLVDKAEKKGK